MIPASPPTSNARKLTAAQQVRIGSIINAICPALIALNWPTNELTAGQLDGIKRLPERSAILKAHLRQLAVEVSE